MLLCLLAPSRSLDGAIPSIPSPSRHPSSSPHPCWLPDACAPHPPSCTPPPPPAPVLPLRHPVNCRNTTDRINNRHADQLNPVPSRFSSPPPRWLPRPWVDTGPDGNINTCTSPFGDRSPRQTPPATLPVAPASGWVRVRGSASGGTGDKSLFATWRVPARRHHQHSHFAPHFSSRQMGRGRDRKRCLLFNSPHVQRTQVESLHTSKPELKYYSSAHKTQEIPPTVPPEQLTISEMVSGLNIYSSAAVFSFRDSSVSLPRPSFQLKARFPKSPPSPDDVGFI
ncbi:hypothetical protein FN846DRAFT_421164 [Sphaerosporella brunnea]|uniref:Uncharacterized protein n=1 Tax=Sphaerosporella brunnea TaxID=1250544 RepID=A0A5J5EHA4_9PEZI|nr:hypothetical protein FN846DRAFT_421164 [Sphaerosporella brunnea]